MTYKHMYRNALSFLNQFLRTVDIQEQLKYATL